MSLSSPNLSLNTDARESAALCKGPRAPVGVDVKATGLRTALWRCDLGAELPHWAGSATVGIRPKPEVHDRRLSGGPLE